MTIPISLDYLTTGIKVEEISSDIGLGWVLNAEGVLTRNNREIMNSVVMALLLINLYQMSFIQDIWTKVFLEYSLSHDSASDFYGDVDWLFELAEGT